MLLLGDKPIYKTDDYASDNGFFTKIATGYKNANGIDIKTDENKRIDFTGFEVAETPAFTVADKLVLELTLTGDYTQKVTIEWYADADWDTFKIYLLYAFGGIIGSSLIVYFIVTL